MLGRHEGCVVSGSGGAGSTGAGQALGCGSHASAPHTHVRTRSREHTHLLVQLPQLRQCGALFVRPGLATAAAATAALRRQ